MADAYPYSIAGAERLPCGMSSARTLSASREMAQIAQLEYAPVPNQIKQD
jgi:hypothetical protein